MVSLHRRHLLVSAATLAATSLFNRPAPAQEATTLTYRGFTVDTTAAQSAANLKDVEKSLKHQIDVAADCGATPKIIDFFKSQTIFVKPGQGDGGGRFSSKVKGVAVDIAVDAPEKPVVLHEMLHAYHWWVLPDGFKNAEVEQLRARPERRLLPAGLLRAQERAGVLCRHRQPLSLGQRRPPPARPQDAARQATGLLQMAG